MTDRSQFEPGQFEEDEFDWSWIKQARTHELSAHGREVQARWSADPGPPPRRPSLANRLRFRLYLIRQRRRSRGSDRVGGT